MVATYRRYDHLAACLDALQAQSAAPGAREILVVDNGMDAAARTAFRWPEEVNLIVADRPGLSHARNLGVAAARGDVVAFIDDDALAGADWLAALLRAFAETPEAGAVGGRVVPIWPQARPDWLHPWQEGYLSIVDLGPEPRALQGHEWLAGTNIAFRTSILRELGPFPEHLGRFRDVLLGNEEIALLARLRACGWRVQYDPRLVVLHHIHAERLTQAWLRRRIAWQAVADLLLDDDPDVADVPELWRRVASYLEQVPPAARGPIALMREISDPELFRQQGQAIGAFLRLLAVHGEDVERAVLGPAA